MCDHIQTHQQRYMRLYLRKKVEILDKLGTPKQANYYKWGTSSSVQPILVAIKVQFLSNFSNINRKLNYSLYPMPKKQIF